MARATWLPFILVASSLLNLAPVRTFSAELPSCDASQSNLTVVHTESAGQRIHGASSLRPLAADQGHRIVVVALEGTVSTPCRLKLLNLFTATDPQRQTSYGSKGIFWYEPTDEINFLDVNEKGEMLSVTSTTKPPAPSWIIGGIVIPSDFRKPSKITFKVAFILPERMATFYIYGPGLALKEITM
jgi:hypothetical protein